jgi:hypothetical protein
MSETLAKVLVMLVMIAGSFLAMFHAFNLVKPEGLWRWLIRKKKKSPLKEKLLRGPGETLRTEEFNTAILFAVQAVLFIFIAYLIGILFVNLKLKGPIPVWHIFLIGAYFCLFIFYMRLLPGYARSLVSTRLGLDGEIATAQELNQLMLSRFFVYHDFPADNFNIDHVVIGPTGVYAVETKTRSKSIKKERNAHKVSFDGKYLIFPDYKNQDFIIQAKNQAKWLSDFLNKSVGKPIKVTPVLALPGWMVDRHTQDTSLYVINPKECAKIIPGRPIILDEQTIQQVKYQVEERCRTLNLFEPI